MPIYYATAKHFDRRKTISTTLQGKLFVRSDFVKALLELYSPSTANYEAVVKRTFNF